MVYCCRGCDMPMETVHSAHKPGCPENFAQRAEDEVQKTPMSRTERRAAERRDAKALRKENAALRLEIAALRELKGRLS